MMKSILKLITATFLAVAPMTSVAQSNVAHINVQQLISEMPEVIAAQNELANLKKIIRLKLITHLKNFKQRLKATLQMLQTKLM